MKNLYFTGIGLLFLSSSVWAATPPLPPMKPDDSVNKEVTEVASMPIVTAYRSVLTLPQVIEEAIKTNPDVAASARDVELAIEGVDLARSNYRPNVVANAGISHIRSNNDVQDSWSSATPKTAGLSLVQPLYRGGRTMANIDEQESVVKATSHQFLDAVQQKILETVNAYMNVYRARQAVDVNADNRARLKERLNATRAGVEVGELTRTDLSQAEARLAEAEADFIAAKASLDIALSGFRQVTGIMAPGPLEYPIVDGALVPATLGDALRVAETENPSLRAAYEQLRAQDYNIEEQKGSFLPEVNLAAGVDTVRDPANGNYDREDTASVSVNATLPLYQSGVLRNQLRQAKIARARTQAALESARRAVTDEVVSAWENYNAANTQVIARKSQVTAARIARDGVAMEQTVGARSILDVLDANVDVKNAELALIEAQSNAIVNYYALLVAIGKFDAYSWDNLQTSL